MTAEEKADQMIDQVMDDLKNHVAKVRALRARVFGRDISDLQWHTLAATWMQPENVRWLQAHDFDPATAAAKGAHV